MDWSEDKILLDKLEKLEKLEFRDKEIAELKDQLAIKQKELDHRFKIITEQSDIIKRYRCFIKNLKLDETINELQNKITEESQQSCCSQNKNLVLTEASQMEPLEEHLSSTSTEGEQLSSSNPEEKELSVGSYDSHSSTEVLKDTSPISVIQPSPAVIVKKRQRDPDSKTEAVYSKIKLRRLNEIVEQNQIKFPTAEDMNYKDTAIGQTIWSTIIKCFRKYPGGMITENMIIEEGGKHVFNPRENFLDKKMVHKYFTHPFQYNDNDKKMAIRPVLMANGLTSWMVLIPDWLKDQFRQEMCDYQLPKDRQFSLNESSKDSQSSDDHQNIQV